MLRTVEEIIQRSFVLIFNTCIFPNDAASCGGVEVAGWTVDLTIRVRFLAYPHRVWAL